MITENTIMEKKTKTKTIDLLKVNKKSIYSIHVFVNKTGCCNFKPVC